MKSMMFGEEPEIDFGSEFDPLASDETQEDDDGVFAAIAEGVFDAKAPPEARAASLREAIMHVLGGQG